VRYDDVQELRRIRIDPAVMGGKACIRGMRVTVGMVVEAVAAGLSVPDLLRDFPYLEEEDIREPLRMRPALRKGVTFKFSRSTGPIKQRPAIFSEKTRRGRKHRAATRHCPARFEESMAASQNAITPVRNKEVVSSSRGRTLRRRQCPRETCIYTSLDLGLSNR
jgi:uncharacterized protein (DUF433 family)